MKLTIIFFVSYLLIVLIVPGRSLGLGNNTLMVKKDYYDLENSCIEKAKSLMVKIMLNESYGFSIMSQGNELQDNLESEQYKEIFKNKYSQKIGNLIEEGQKFGKQRTDIAEITEMDLGMPYFNYLTILESAEDLKKNDKIDIFDLRSLAKVCTEVDVKGFTYLYQPILREAIERQKNKKSRWSTWANKSQKFMGVGKKRNNSLNKIVRGVKNKIKGVKF